MLIFPRPVKLSQISLFLINFFFFNDTATTEIYTLSLHDALPISTSISRFSRPVTPYIAVAGLILPKTAMYGRSEEHTSELQSLTNLVCRLLLEKKKRVKTRRSNLNLLNW